MRGLGVWGAWVAGAMILLVSAPAPADELETAVREAYPTNEGMLTQATAAAVAELFIGFKVPDGASLRVEAAIEHRANWFVEIHLLAYLADTGYRAYLAKSPPSTESPAPPPLPPPDSPSRMLPHVAHRAGSVDSLTASADSARGLTVPGDSAEIAISDTLDGTVASPNSVPPGAGPIAASNSNPPPVLDETEPDYVLRYRVVLCELSYPEKYRTSPFGSSKVQRRASVSLVAQLLQGKRQDVIWVGKGNVERVNVVPAGKLTLLAGTDFPFNPPALEQKGMGGYVEPVLVTGIVAGLIYLFYANQD